MFYIYPWKKNSAGAKRVIEELEGKYVFDGGYDPSKDILINWGNGDGDYPEALNHKIMDLIDKVQFFKRLDGTGLTPEYSTTLEGAKALGYPVFCRKETQGKDGQGITVADCAAHLVPAGLYVKGIDKTSEYRVHVGRLPDGTIEVLGGNKKSKKPLTDDMTNVPTDNRVWTGDQIYFGDFLYEADLPPPVAKVARQTLEVMTELTFAGLDIIYDNSEARAYVIEGNSAPLVTPMTAKAYGRFFRKLEELSAKQVPQALPSVAVPATPVVAEAPAKLTPEEVLYKVPLGDLIKCYIANQ